MSGSDLLAAALQRHDVLILDGAMGTELERRGLNLADPLWSARALAEAPQQVAAVHRDYLAAGADVIVSASYQASVEGFAARGIAEASARGLIGRSVEIAVTERDQFWDGQDRTALEGRIRPIVAGGIGPFGAMLADGSEFRGDYDMDPGRLSAFHRPRVEALLEAGAELLAIETLPSRREGEVIADLLEREFPQASAWVCFSARDDARLSDGEPVEVAVRSLSARAGVAALGINCTAPVHIARLVERIAAASDKPIAVYPNRGGAWDPAAHAWRDEDEPSASLAAQARTWRAAGARLIGGCCRTTPGDVAALRTALL